MAIGDASEEIVRAAEEIDANLIAMSTHRRSGLSRWAFGRFTRCCARIEELLGALRHHNPCLLMVALLLVAR